MFNNSTIIIFIMLGLAPVFLSYLVEVLRKKPETPNALNWSDDIQIQYININGVRLRYIETGKGPALVLLHTLRTQLDIFQKVIPDLSKHFTVYALDYPGHGYSDIPKTE
jgi:alpha-beta hydrolase superfamily lysophospholipase